MAEDTQRGPQQQAQREQWNRREFVQRWRDVEPSNAPVSAALFAALALQPGEHVLDIGCGGGPTTLEAAAAVKPGGSATGFDISMPMIEIARQRADEAGLRNVTFAIGDAQSDTPPGGPFDVAISRFGVMFFADPIAAFSNIRAQLHPGARVAFATWQHVTRNRWFPMEVMAKYRNAPPPPPGTPPPPGPFALGDEAYARSIFERAGFQDIALTPHGYEWREPVKAVDGMLLEALNLDSETKARALADMQAHAASMTVDGEIRQERNYWIVTARNA